MANPEHVILDFGLHADPFGAGRQIVKANHRIVMDLYTTKRLLTALALTIQRHEKMYGPIDLNLNRRASGHVHPIMQYQPEVSSLP